MDIELLVSLTDDRGGTMERLRSRHRPEGPERANKVAALQYATTLFERNVLGVPLPAGWMREQGETNLGDGWELTGPFP